MLAAEVVVGGDADGGFEVVAVLVERRAVVGGWLGGLGDDRTWPGQAGAGTEDILRSSYSYRRPSTGLSLLAMYAG